MATKARSYVLSGLQLGINPLATKDGEFIRLVNVDHDPIGALKKRPGYVTYLDPLGAQINTLFNWSRNDGTTFWNYALAGGTLFYSTQGTGAWTVCGNGTFSGGTIIGNGVVEDTLMVGDGINATRHTTNGTSFSNTSGAPIASDFVDFQGRMWAMGTSSNEFYSTTGTPTDWTSDSSSILIPGPGKLLKTFKTGDRIVLIKNNGAIFKADGIVSLVDTATKSGPASAQSVGEVEGYRFWLNRLGYFGFNGDKPEIVSNAIERQVYNDAGSAIAGTTFDSAPGVVYRYDYMCAVGSVTDDLTSENIPRALQVYDFQLDQWRNYNFGTMPTAFTTYVDQNRNTQLIFGDSAGQCYTFGGTATSDNTASIEVIIEEVYTGGAPETEKKFNWFWASFNPGCQAKIQIAVADTFTKQNLNWMDLGQALDGIVEYRFPPGSRGRLLFIKITESSRDARFRYYGRTVDWDPIIRN